MEEAEIAVALRDADHHFFVVVLGDMSVAAIHAADIGNVHLDFSIQHRLISLRHSVPDAMAEIPSRLVAADAERALNLAGRHSFFCFAEEKGCSKPRRKWQVRIIENRSSGHGE